MLTAAGLMSGTSADGISAAVIRTEGRRVRLLAHREFPYPKGLRGRIHRAARGEARTPELSALNWEIGRAFAAAAVRLIGGRRVDVIGSHGQTVWHEPSSHTLQIGEGAVIAEVTGITTVCDFRPADVAAGGQGAPLVPWFDWRLFGGRPVALLNIGGIANLTFPGRTLAATRGFDTGPGNALIDEAMREAYGRDFDRDGRIARSGRIDLRILERLDHPYFRRRPPKSTGRELFSREYLLKRCGRELMRRPADVVASLTYFTAKTIGEAFARSAPRGVQEVVVSGGGALNRTMMSHLAWTLWPAATRPIEVFGFPALAKEAAAFALLAVEAVRGAAAGIPAVTGAKRAAILGKIVPGAGFRALMKRLHA